MPEAALEPEPAAVAPAPADPPAGEAVAAPAKSEAAPETDEYASTLSVEGTAIAERLADVTSVCSAGEYADPSYMEGDEACADEVPPAAPSIASVTHSDVAAPTAAAEEAPEAALEAAAAVTGATAAAASGTGAAAAATPALDDTAAAVGLPPPSHAKLLAFTGHAETVDAWVREWIGWSQQHASSLALAAGGAIALVGLMTAVSGSGRRRHRL